jgi:hypothetical protein
VSVDKEQVEKEVVAVLRAARERIAPPERWTTRAYARDKNGLEVEAHSDDAVCWCAAGAVAAELGVSAEAVDDPHALNPAITHLVEAAKPRLVSARNDKDGHASVLALYDRAIARATSTQPVSNPATTRGSDHG